MNSVHKQVYSPLFAAGNATACELQVRFDLDLNTISLTLVIMYQVWFYWRTR